MEGFDFSHFNDLEDKTFSYEESIFDNYSLRDEVVSWFIVVDKNTYCFHSEELFFTIRTFDRILEKCNNSISDDLNTLKLYILTSLRLVIKYNFHSTTKEMFEEFLKDANIGYTLKDLYDAEFNALNILNYNLHMTTLSDYIDIFNHVLDSDKRMIEMSYIIAKFSSCFYMLSEYKYSVLALSIILLIRKILTKNKYTLPEHIFTLSGVDKDKMSECYDILKDLYEDTYSNKNSFYYLNFFLV